MEAMPSKQFTFLRSTIRFGGFTRERKTSTAAAAAAMTTTTTTSINQSTKLSETWEYTFETKVMVEYIIAFNFVRIVIVLYINFPRDLLCQISGNFGEFGAYDVVVDEKNCEYTVREEPVNIYIPLLVVSIGLFVLYVLIRLAGRCRLKETVTDESTNTKANKKPTRILSIDTFRGFALCFMIFVNDGGGQYWFFNHSTWDGLYPADVLFPWFLWIMGVCIPLSQRTLSEESHCVFALTRNILQRFAILFLLGLSLNTLGVGPVDLSELRIPGVLQRIAICYAVVSLISVFVLRLQMRLCPSFNNYWSILVPQWLVHLCILYAHYYLTFYLPVPACPRGYLGSGGIQNNKASYNCTGGATGYLDRAILGESHLYQHAAVNRVYRTPIPFDPENILGCLTSIFQTFLGTQAGFILRERTSPPASKIRRLLICSVVSLSVGLILHYTNAIPLNKNLWYYYQQRSQVRPISNRVDHAIRHLKDKSMHQESWRMTTVKPSIKCTNFPDFTEMSFRVMYLILLRFTPPTIFLWSLSFVFATSGLAFFVFTVFYYTVDYAHLWDGAPFIYPGTNSVLVYVGHEICFQLFPWHWKITTPTMNTHFLQLVENTWGVLLWIIITYIMFEKRIFLNV